MRRYSEASCAGVCLDLGAEALRIDVTDDGPARRSFRVSAVLKLGLRDRVQVAALAYRTGLVQAGEAD